MRDQLNRTILRWFRKIATLIFIQLLICTYFISLSRNDPGLLRLSFLPPLDLKMLAPRRSWRSASEAGSDNAHWQHRLGGQTLPRLASSTE